MILWWILVISLLQAPLIILIFPLLVVIPARNIRIGVQLVAAIAFLFVSPLISILLLLATAVGAWLETVDHPYKFAISATGLTGLTLLFPGLSPPIGTYLLLGLLWAIPFLRQHLVEWRRITAGVSLFLGGSLILVTVIRLLKEALFGSVANLTRPALEAFGSLFTWTLPLAEQIDQKTGAQATDLSNIAPQESLKAASMSSDTLFYLNMAGIVLAILAVGITFYLIRKRQVVSTEPEPVVRMTGMKQPAPIKKHSQHPLLKIASQLEQAFPRRHEETTVEWLTRIDFPEAVAHARLLDGIEFSRSEPAYDLQLFRKYVREQIER
ncbi:hypothetical protein [Exiguobacterium sp. RIT594]|uniref:hypothetical protein n=1 Tax=Exiguobacterium sp. RIT594 TaxID=2282449 RepID=UPI000DF7986F|nr:hypothetical protein [Exiguobacterium sp. RIT594]RDB34041.1 hypothetical protein DVG79_05015 [Exiguobacterium sp. RIT594]